MEKRERIGKALFFGGLLSIPVLPLFAGEIPLDHGLGISWVSATLPRTDIAWIAGATSMSIGLGLMTDRRTTGDRLIESASYATTIGLILGSNLIHGSNEGLSNFVLNVSPFAILGGNLGRALSNTKKSR